VILDIEGESKETVVISAHYDSTVLSTGAYDNMSGCIGLLYLAEYFSAIPHRRRIRLLWCGSEERGLLGSQEYCRIHKSELTSTVLNINLDMLGSVMGEFVAFSCVNDEMSDFLAKFLAKHRFPASVRHAIRSSDSNSFVYCGVPAVSFARYAPPNMAPIHTRYDKPQTVSAKQLLSDMKIIAQFVEHIANTVDFSFSMEISEKIKIEVEKYMKRKLFAVRESKR
jgi:Zn-dependent M28 family amino/carboxypeptidase